jgi:hypothetical protein
MITLEITETQALMLLEMADNAKETDLDCLESYGECETPRYYIDDKTADRWEHIIRQLRSGIDQEVLDETDQPENG